MTVPGVRGGTRARMVLNAALFQAAWFAVVLGAAHGRPWLGVIAVPAAFALHLALAADRQAELLLAAAAAGLGFATDSALIAAGVLAPVPSVFPAPFSPLWMVMLWVNLAMTLNASLAWMRGSYALAAFLGAVGGPAAYYSGATLGALLSIPSPRSLVAIGGAWALAFPVLLKVNEVVRRRTARPGAGP